MESTRTSFQDPAEEIGRIETGRNKEFIVTFYKRIGTMRKGSWTKLGFFYSFIISRRSPMDGKIHRFFRERDIDEIKEFLPVIQAEINRFKTLEKPDVSMQDVSPAV